MIMELILRSTQSLFRVCNKSIAYNRHIPIRLSGYYNSPLVQDLEIKTKYEITKSPEDWHYVERLLPPTIVPKLQPREHYNSGFKPQSENVRDQPYFITRTKNHMIPVYLLIKQRGIRKLTNIRKIQGDIWLLGKEIEEFLQPMSKTPIRMQINEFTGIITINGDYVNAIIYWLQERGF